MANTNTTDTIHVVTTGRGPVDQRQRLAACTSEDEAAATASTWQRAGVQDVNIHPVPVQD
jgi:hypothetical protein